MSGTPNRSWFLNVLADFACIPAAMVAQATAILRAQTPYYTKALSTAQGQNYTDPIQNEINLWVECGSAGDLYFRLVRDGAGDYQYLKVVAGQRVYGHFYDIGPNTSVYPLVGFGNLP